MPRANKSERDELTMKQRKFVNAYCESGNATNAAIKAGYSENTAESQGSRLLKNVKIRKAIEAKEREFEMASLITKEYVLSALKDIADNKDEQTQNKIRALENLGRYLSMFTDKQIIQNENSNPFEQMSDEEIMKMYEEQKRFKKQG
jgi:phage terminase small subunit